MRLTVLCTDLGIRIGDVKGASVHLEAITTAFAALGHDVQLIAVGGRERPSERLSGAVHDLVLVAHPGRADGLERERRKLAVVDYVADELRDRVRAFDPDAIYERLSLFGDAGSRLADLLGVPLAVEVNALLADEDARWRGLHLPELANARERSVLAGAEVLIAVSDEVAHQIVAREPRCEVDVVPNGVDLDRFGERLDRDVARRRLGIDPDAPTVCFVGALRPWHGVDVLLAALSKTERIVGALIAGDGPVLDELRSIAAHLGIGERVRFIGSVPHDEVPWVIAAADAAIAPYPNLAEFAFSPLKLFEYLATGTPVVASALGQIPQLLDGGRLGTLVAPGDPVDLARAIDEVVGSQRARRVADRARVHALAHHGWPQRASTILERIAQEVRRHALVR